MCASPHGYLDERGWEGVVICASPHGYLDERGWEGVVMCASPHGYLDERGWLYVHLLMDTWMRGVGRVWLCVPAECP